MQFLVTAYDGADDKALERRMAARAAHIASGDRLRDAGKLIYAAAILDDAEKMIGSVLVYEVAGRRELDECLQADPYVAGGVWATIDVKRCRTGPSFAPKVRPGDGR